MIQYNIDISNKEDVELAMQDLYSISKAEPSGNENQHLNTVYMPDLHTST